MSERSVTFAPEVRAVIAYSDPVERTSADGRVIKPGHQGGIYKAFNGRLAGRSSPRTLLFAPDGRVVSGRSLSKIRQGEQGAGYAERSLVEMGAPLRMAGESSEAYVAAQLAQLAQGQTRFCCLPLRCELTELACGSRWATAGEHTVCRTCPDGQRRRAEAGGGRIEVRPQLVARVDARPGTPAPPRQAEPGQPTRVQRARAEMALAAIQAMPGGCASPSMLAPMMPPGLRRSSTISKALALLADEGVIERMSRGVYRVPGGAPGLPPVGDSDEERRRAVVMALARSTPSGVDAKATAAHIGTTALDAHHPRQQLLNLARVALRVLCSRGWLTRVRVDGRRGWVYLAAEFGAGVSPCAPHAADVVETAASLGISAGELGAAVATLKSRGPR